MTLRLFFVVLWFLANVSIFVVATVLLALAHEVADEHHLVLVSYPSICATADIGVIKVGSPGFFSE